MLRALPPVVEPETWVLAFHKTSPYWWVRLLAIGRYKHVSAFAWVAPLELWVYYDITLLGTKLILLPDSAIAASWLMAQTADADLVNVKTWKHLKTSGLTRIAPFYCVPAIKHLIGLRCGALLPTTLYDHVLAHGGELIHGRAGKADDQPGTTAPAGAGQS